jgi:hypothetical protein
VPRLARESLQPLAPLLPLDGATPAPLVKILRDGHDDPQVIFENLNYEGHPRELNAPKD